MAHKSGDAVTGRSEINSPEIAEYAQRHTTPPDALQLELTEATVDRTSASSMQISPQQATLMSLLTRALQPELAIEVGTFTGYSALAIARALPPGGKLICCDISEEWTAIGREYWERAGVADRIDLHIGPARDTLRALPAEPQVGLAFIDADKTGYIDYYEELVPRLKPSGLILVDNVLWSGDVLTSQAPSGSDTAALQEFNRHVLEDPRTTVALLPISDGVSVIGLAG